VLVFVDEIQGFYDASAPKLPFEEDDPETDGWAGFWAEWRQRRTAAS
jgi:hypothetical protein